MAEPLKHGGLRKRSEYDASGPRVVAVEEADQPRGWIRVGEGGRVVIPSEVRERLSIQAGDRLWFTLDSDGALRLMTHRGTIRRLQELARPYLAGRGSLADELIEERRAEAADE